LKEDLLSVREALDVLLKEFQPLGLEQEDIATAYQRVLGEDVRAEIDLPTFNNSSMDGFAVRSQDTVMAAQTSPIELQVVADIPAGSFPTGRLEAGQAMRIMTGAPLPEGADAVIPIENTDFQFRNPEVTAPESVHIFQSSKPGDFIRPRGQDIHRGEVVLSAGKVLRAQEIGLLATLGFQQVRVFRKPRVALVSTGDEIKPVGEKLTPGKIYDSNSYTLSALVQQANGVPMHLGIVPDRYEAVKTTLDEAVNKHVDLIISSAGVSVGAFDFVRQVVEAYGKLNFWRVKMRPGKPLTFGWYQDIPFIGLPGNPVSAFVGFQVFIQPAMRRMLGLAGDGRVIRKAILAEAVESDGRESYLRAIVSQAGGGLTARLTGHQGSGNLRSLVQANAFLIIPSEVKSLPIGAEVDAWMIDEREF
jgi:molybdopterin molybdotransferase